jgi:hypothetical protein
MQIALPFTEALALAATAGPLPPMVRSVRAEGSTVHAEVDLRQVPSASGAARLAFAAIGTVEVQARLINMTHGTATVEVRAEARGLPAHKLLRHLSGMITAVLRERGLPEDLVEVQQGVDAPLLLMHVQRAVDERVEGVVVTGLGLRDAVIYAEVTIGAVRLH